MKLVAVESIEEEWRTNTFRVQHPLRGPARRSYGRACLWIRKVCGHYPEQRMVKLDKDGRYKEPRSVRCDECG